MKTETKIRDKFLENLKEILSKYNAYLVGGYLRNYFINGTISNDRDIVVEFGAKELAQAITKFYDAAFVELDSENKIYILVLKDKVNYFDISEALENNIETDAKRRDFTVNSIFYDLKNSIIYDPFDGIKDIQNKILKASDLNNLKDDPLRILRLYRFYSTLGFEIESSLNEFAKKSFNLILNSAFERINQEIILLFGGKYISQTLLKMFDDGVLEILFPFVKEIKKIPSNTHHHLDLVHHSIETVKNIRYDNPYLKIAAFMHDIGKPKTWTIEENGRHRFIGHDILGYDLAAAELKRLKFPKKKIKYIAKMVKNHIYPATLVQNNATKKAFARFVKKLGADAPDVIELSRADRLSARGVAVTDEMVKAALNHLENLLNYYNEVSSMIEAPTKLLNGEEIMRILNLSPGKIIGELSDKLLEAQMIGQVKDKQEAIKFIKDLKSSINTQK